jgi:hypothetical protein
MSDAAGFFLATLFADACDGADASELILAAARLLSSAMIASAGAGGVLRGRPRLRVTTSADIIFGPPTTSREGLLLCRCDLSSEFLLSFSFLSQILCLVFTGTVSLEEKEGGKKL